MSAFWKDRDFMSALFSWTVVLLIILPSITIARTIDGETSRPDGSVIHWSLAHVGEQRPKKMIYLGQGSGCQSVKGNKNIALMASKLPEWTVLTVEKYGVRPGDDPKDVMDHCTDQYFDHHTVSQRAEDVVRVLVDLEDRKMTAERLALFGGSEGGAVVAILGGRLPDVDAMILLSMGTGMTLADTVPTIVPEADREWAEDYIKRIRKTPGEKIIWGGNSFNWWADIMDRRLADDLLASSSPVLIVHGMDDRTMPIETSRITRDMFEKAGQTRLTYWELPGRDHEMKDVQGVSHMSKTLDDMIIWLSKAIEQ